ncbi:FIVAR domain-containing protein [Lactobacillus psittaci]|uniref:Atypical Rib domain-containing protein n=1 Tax=Lactobacillus psittaci DSM 15354 TaxID=1122152 RepID=A0A0R1S1H8_9LACO|nr:FIVAR domain-containing protein [Lactobacillus psittaci]KRL62967.1 hypothetical protein FC23_GL001151 [Lactobacillus psittaci DSM 15354]
MLFKKKSPSKLSQHVLAAMFSATILFAISINNQVTADALSDSSDKSTSSGSLPPAKLADSIKMPDKVTVANQAALSADELAQIKKNIETANPNATAIVNDDGSARVQFIDGSTHDLTSQNTFVSNSAETDKTSDNNKAESSNSETQNQTNNSNSNTSEDKADLAAAVNFEDTVKRSAPYKGAKEKNKQAYNQAVAAGQKILSQNNASQSQIDQATSAINKANAQLDGHVHKVKNSKPKKKPAASTKKPQASSQAVTAHKKAQKATSKPKKSNTSSIIIGFSSIGLLLALFISLGVKIKQQ